MPRFWQLFRPALARKAGQRDPQTLVGGLGARHGTSRSNLGKKFSLSAMILRTQAASACDKRHSAPTRQAFSKVAAACTPSFVRKPVNALRAACRVASPLLPRHAADFHGFGTI